MTGWDLPGYCDQESVDSHVSIRNVGTATDGRSILVEERIAGKNIHSAIYLRGHYEAESNSPLLFSIECRAVIVGCALSTVDTSVISIVFAYSSELCSPFLTKQQFTRQHAALESGVDTHCILYDHILALTCTDPSCICILNTPDTMESQKLLKDVLTTFCLHPVKTASSNMLLTCFLPISAADEQACMDPGTPVSVSLMTRKIIKSRLLVFEDSAFTAFREFRISYAIFKPLEFASVTELSAHRPYHIPILQRIEKLKKAFTYIRTHFKRRMEERLSQFIMWDDHKEIHGIARDSGLILYRSFNPIHGDCVIVHDDNSMKQSVRSLTVLLYKASSEAIDTAPSMKLMCKYIVGPLPKFTVNPFDNVHRPVSYNTMRLSFHVCGPQTPVLAAEFYWYNDEEITVKSIEKLLAKAPNGKPPGYICCCVYNLSNGTSTKLSQQLNLPLDHLEYSYVDTCESVDSMDQRPFRSLNLFDFRSLAERIGFHFARTAIEAPEREYHRTVTKHALKFLTRQNFLMCTETYVFSSYSVLLWIVPDVCKKTFSSYIVSCSPWTPVFLVYSGSNNLYGVSPKSVFRRIRNKAFKHAPNNEEDFSVYYQDRNIVSTMFDHFQISDCEDKDAIIGASMDKECLSALLTRYSPNEILSFGVGYRTNASIKPGKPDVTSRDVSTHEAFLKFPEDNLVIISNTSSANYTTSMHLQSMDSDTQNKSTTRYSNHGVRSSNDETPRMDHNTSFRIPSNHSISHMYDNILPYHVNSDYCSAVNRNDTGSGLRAFSTVQDEHTIFSYVEGSSESHDEDIPGVYDMHSDAVTYTNFFRVCTHLIPYSRLKVASYRLLKLVGITRYSSVCNVLSNRYTQLPNLCMGLLEYFDICNNTSRQSSETNVPFFNRLCSPSHALQKFFLKYCKQPISDRFIETVMSLSLYDDNLCRFVSIRINYGLIFKRICVQYLRCSLTHGVFTKGLLSSQYNVGNEKLHGDMIRSMEARRTLKETCSETPLQVISKPLSPDNDLPANDLLISPVLSPTSILHKNRKLSIDETSTQTTRSSVTSLTKIDSPAGPSNVYDHPATKLERIHSISASIPYKNVHHAEAFEKHVSARNAAATESFIDNNDCFLNIDRYDDQATEPVCESDAQLTELPISSPGGQDYFQQQSLVEPSLEQEKSTTNQSLTFNYYSKRLNDLLPSLKPFEEHTTHDDSLICSGHGEFVLDGSENILERSSSTTAKRNAGRTKSLSFLESLVARRGALSSASPLTKPIDVALASSPQIHYQTKKKAQLIRKNPPNDGSVMDDSLNYNYATAIVLFVKLCRHVQEIIFLVQVFICQNAPANIPRNQVVEMYCTTTISLIRRIFRYAAGIMPALEKFEAMWAQTCRAINEGTATDGLETVTAFVFLFSSYLLRLKESFLSETIAGVSSALQFTNGTSNMNATNLLETDNHMCCWADLSIPLNEEQPLKIPFVEPVMLMAVILTSHTLVHYGHHFSGGRAAWESGPYDTLSCSLMFKYYTTKFLRTIPKTASFRFLVRPCGDLGAWGCHWLGAYFEKSCRFRETLMQKYYCPENSSKSDGPAVYFPELFSTSMVTVRNIVSMYGLDRTMAEDTLYRIQPCTVREFTLAVHQHLVTKQAILVGLCSKKQLFVSLELDPADYLLSVGELLENVVIIPGYASAEKHTSSTQEAHHHSPLTSSIRTRTTGLFPYWYYAYCMSDEKSFRVILSHIRFADIKNYATLYSRVPFFQAGGNLDYGLSNLYSLRSSRAHTLYLEQYSGVCLHYSDTRTVIRPHSDILTTLLQHGVLQSLYARASLNITHRLLSDSTLQRLKRLEKDAENPFQRGDALVSRFVQSRAEAKQFTHRFSIKRRTMYRLLQDYPLLQQGTSDQTSFQRNMVFLKLVFRRDETPVTAVLPSNTAANASLFLKDIDWVAQYQSHYSGRIQNVCVDRTLDAYFDSFR